MIQLDYAVMLVNEAETAVRSIDPDLEFACVTVAVQPSVAQLKVGRTSIVNRTYTYSAWLSYFNNSAFNLIFSV